MRSFVKGATLVLSLLALAGCGNSGGGGVSELTVKFIDSADLTTEVATAQTVKYGEKASKPADPVKSGFEFDGWFKDKYCKVAFDFDVAITANWTIYAGWTGGEPGPSSSDSSATTSASTGELDHIVYFKAASWWSADGARTSAYLWTGGDHNAEWPGVVCEKEGDYWKLDLTDNTYENLIFARYSANDADANKDWGAKTVDIAISSIDWSKPVYDTSASPTIWGDPGVTGVWKALE